MISSIKQFAFLGLIASSAGCDSLTSTLTSFTSVSGQAAASCPTIAYQPSIIRTSPDTVTLKLVNREPSDSNKVVNWLDVHYTITPKAVGSTAAGSGQAQQTNRRLIAPDQVSTTGPISNLNAFQANAKAVETSIPLSSSDQLTFSWTYHERNSAIACATPTFQTVGSKIPHQNEQSTGVAQATTGTTGTAEATGIETTTAQATGVTMSATATIATEMAGQTTGFTGQLSETAASATAATVTPETLVGTTTGRFEDEDEDEIIVPTLLTTTGVRSATGVSLTGTDESSLLFAHRVIQTLTAPSDDSTTTATTTTASSFPPTLTGSAFTSTGALMMNEAAFRLPTMTVTGAGSSTTTTVSSATATLLNGSHNSTQVDNEDDEDGSDSLSSTGVVRMQPRLTVISGVCPNLSYKVLLSRAGEQSISRSSGTSPFSVLFVNEDDAMLDWADVHYAVNDEEFSNFKLASDVDQSGVVQKPIMQLKPNDKLTFFITYKVQGAKWACDTNIIQMKAKQIGQNQQVDTEEQTKDNRPKDANQRQISRVQ